jgi:hypothetical protein
MGLKTEVGKAFMGVVAWALLVLMIGFVGLTIFGRSLRSRITGLEERAATLEDWRTEDRQNLLRFADHLQFTMDKLYETRQWFIDYIGSQPPKPYPPESPPTSSNLQARLNIGLVACMSHVDPDKEGWWDVYSACAAFKCGADPKCVVAGEDE